MPRGIRKVNMDEISLEKENEGDMIEPKKEEEKSQISSESEKIIEDLLRKNEELEKEKMELEEKLKETPEKVENVQEEIEPEVIEDPYAAAVHEICGKDFEVQINPISPANFQLIIIPPVHLRECPEDRRVKVISHIEGINGVNEYAKRVKIFCVNWAQKNGINYEKAKEENN